MKSEAEMLQGFSAVVEERALAFEKQKLLYEEPARKTEILSEIQARFIKGNPRAWWSSFLSKPIMQSFDDNSGYLHVCNFVPPSTDNVWLIVDEDNEAKYLLSLPLRKVPSVLEECRFFEYYIVDKQLNWMMAENDHGDLMLSSAQK
jgi:hypothetical protein